MPDLYHIYVAGPMTSVGGNFNFPLFDHVSSRLRATNRCVVFNPADLAREKLGSFEEIKKMDKEWLNQARGRLLKIEINWIMDNADQLITLPGWERSEGAKAERQVAIAFNIPVRMVPNIVLYDSPIDEVVKRWDTEILKIEDGR